MSITIKAISSKSPLKYLSARYQKRLADAAVLTHHKSGEKIFDIGESDGHLAFLLWGEVLLKAVDGRTSPIKHSEDSAQYPLSKLNPRRFSAIAASSQTCILWIDRELLKECMAKQILRNKYERKERQLNLEFSNLQNRALEEARAH